MSTIPERTDSGTEPRRGQRADVNGRILPDQGPHPADRDEPAAAGPPAIRLDTVTREKVRWLWPGRLALGKLSIIDGDPGQGKSVITLDIAARVSTGTPMPGDPPTWVPDGFARGDPAGVLVTCAEDDIADTVIPRLASHGADLGRIGYIPLGRDSEGRLVPLSIPRDLGRIEAAIGDLSARLMIIDPITAYLPESVQTHNDASVRRALTPLADTAQRTGCAIWLVRHLNKDTKGPAMYRGGGSIAFSGSTRAALITAPHPDQPGISVLARVKGNLSVTVASLAYRLVPDDENECPHVQWDGPVDIDADRLLRGKDKRLDAPARDDAADLLRDLLADGPVNASEATKLVADNAGCSERTVRYAAERIGVAKTRLRDPAGKTAGWVWQLPDHHRQPEPPTPPFATGAGSCLEAPEAEVEGHGAWLAPSDDPDGQT
jgi:putative DNA primase/helicase